MCGLCGIIGEKAAWSDAVRSGLPGRRLRQKNIRMLNTLMQYARISISDFQGTGYLVQGATGKQEVADGMVDLLEKIRAVSGCPADILDERLLAGLEKL